MSSIVASIAVIAMKRLLIAETIVRPVHDNVIDSVNWSTLDVAFERQLRRIRLLPRSYGSKSVPVPLAVADDNATNWTCERHNRFVAYCVDGSDVPMLIAVRSNSIYSRVVCVGPFRLDHWRHLRMQPFLRHLHFPLRHCHLRHRLLHFHRLPSRLCRCSFRLCLNLD